MPDGEEKCWGAVWEIICPSVLGAFVDNTGIPLRYHRDDSVVVFRYYQQYFPKLNQKYWLYVGRFLGTFSPISDNVVLSIIPYGAITLYLIFFVAFIFSGIWYTHFNSLDTNSVNFSLLFCADLWLSFTIDSVKSLSLSSPGNFSSGQPIPLVRYDFSVGHDRWFLNEGSRIDIFLNSHP